MKLYPFCRVAQLIFSLTEDKQQLNNDFVNYNNLFLLNHFKFYDC